MNETLSMILANTDVAAAAGLLLVRLLGREGRHRLTANTCASFVKTVAGVGCAPHSQIAGKGLPSRVHLWGTATCPPPPLRRVLLHGEDDDGRTDTQLRSRSLWRRCVRSSAFCRRVVHGRGGESVDGAASLREARVVVVAARHRGRSGVAAAWRG